METVTHAGIEMEITETSGMPAAGGLTEYGYGDYYVVGWRDYTGHVCLPCGADPADHAWAMVDALVAAIERAYPAVADLTIIATLRYGLAMSLYASAYHAMADAMDSRMYDNEVLWNMALASWPAGVLGGPARPARIIADDGLAGRVDRLRCLGNGQVPAVARNAFATLS